MPNRSYPRTAAGGPICINVPGSGYMPLRDCEVVPTITTPGLFNSTLAARHAASHEALFIDPYGQDLRLVGRAQWGQRPS